MEPAAEQGAVRSKEQFRVVVRQLLAAEHAAVPVPAVLARLGKEGEAALEAIVQANLLSYRPMSGKHLLNPPVV